MLDFIYKSTHIFYYSYIKEGPPLVFKEEGTGSI